MNDTDTLAIRRGCAERGWKLRPRFRLAPSTVEAAVTPGMVWINVGTGTGPGIANFRTPRSGVRGSCEAVLQRQSELFAHVFGRWDAPSGPEAPDGGVLEVTICLQELFKPDDAAAAFLVTRLLETGELPKSAPALAAYMAWGRRSAEPNFPTDLEGVPGTDVKRIIEILARERLGDDHRSIPFSLAMTARQWKADSASAGASLDSLRSLVALTETAVTLLERDPPRDGQSLDRKLAAMNWREAAGSRVEEDVREAMTRVLEEHERVERSWCALRLCDEGAGGTTERLEALIVHCSPSVDDRLGGLLRLAYAAGLSPAPQGKRASVVVLHGEHPSRGRWFDISLAIDRVRRHGSLKGLGLALEALEQRRRGSADTRRALHGRFADIPGIADPWYDGRDHEYGLVGGPRASGGSALTIADVQRVLATPYWEAAAIRIGHWTVRVAEHDAAPSTGQWHEGIYRSRLRVPGPGGVETWTYQPSGKGGAPGVRGEVRRPEAEMRAQELPIRLDLGVLGGAAAQDGEFRVVEIDLARPPFMSADRIPSVDECVNDASRNRWRAEVCGPGSRSIELDTDRVADVGPRGIVIWRRPGSEPAAIGGERGPEMARAAMDVLAYRHDLQALIGATSPSATGGRPDSSIHLETFVDIVRSYHPEGTTADIRRMCDAIEDSLSVPTMVERLERFLQFSDERERVRNDRFLQWILLLLASFALLQTPADLLQAWSVWAQARAGAELPQPHEFWLGSGPGGWIAWQLLVSLAGVAVVILLGLSALRLGRRLRRRAAIPGRPGRAKR